MDSQAIRYENLLRLKAEFVTFAEIERLSGASAAYLSQIANGTPLPSGAPRGVGSKLARKLEKGLGKPTGWMDALHDESAPGVREEHANYGAQLTTLEARALAAFQHINTEQKTLIISLMEDLAMVNMEAPDFDQAVNLKPVSADADKKSSAND